MARRRTRKPRSHQNINRVNQNSSNITSKKQSTPKNVNNLAEGQKKEEKNITQNSTKSVAYKTSDTKDKDILAIALSVGVTGEENIQKNSQKNNDNKTNPKNSYSSSPDNNKFTQSLDGFSLTSLGLGIVSFFLPLLCSIPAIIFGIIGLNQIKKNKTAGRGLAFLGIILGVLTTVIIFLVFVISTLWYTNTLYAHNKLETQVIHSAETFGEDLITRTTAGDQLPITKLDAERIFAKNQVSSDDSRLVQWIKTPGAEKACFVIQGKEGNRAGGIVTSSQFVTGTPGKYSPLYGSQTCS